MIRIDEKVEVYVNESGTAPQYRHVWQIRQWLEQRFGITGEKITLLKQIHRFYGRIARRCS
jgi:hypothetical protein